MTAYRQVRNKANKMNADLKKHISQTKYTKRQVI